MTYAGQQKQQEKDDCFFFSRNQIILWANGCRLENYLLNVLFGFYTEVNRGHLVPRTPSEQLNQWRCVGGARCKTTEISRMESLTEEMANTVKKLKNRKIEFIGYVLSVVRSGRQNRKKRRRLPRNTDMSNIRKEIGSKLCVKNWRKKENDDRRRQSDAFKQKYWLYINFIGFFFFLNA